MTSGNGDIPPFVTFSSGATLLNDLGITTGMTSDSVRYMSRHPEWPFGDDKPVPYGKLANARTMETEPFLTFFREHLPAGRGPDRSPRKKRGEAG